VSRPQKRSLTLRGHATSVSLEPEFWSAFRRIAADRDMAINALAAEIDDARDPATGLATALRLFVLADLERRLATAEAQRRGGIE
jgi:predicted DNA-binding ribbon-helix-helix protein